MYLKSTHRAEILLEINKRMCNGVAVAEWLERQYAIFVTLLSWVQIQFGARQDFSSKNYHYSALWVHLHLLRGMWWHDDVLNYYIRNCLTISSIMMDVWNSHGSGECRNNTFKNRMKCRSSMAEKPRLIKRTCATIR